MDIKKETKNFRGGESVGNYRECRVRCVTLLCHGTVRIACSMGGRMFVVWVNLVPVRKELLSQWVFVYIWNATKIKCRLFLLFLEGFSLSEWTASALSLSTRFTGKYSGMTASTKELWIKLTLKINKIIMIGFSCFNHVHEFQLNSQPQCVTWACWKSR